MAVGLSTSLGSVYPKYTSEGMAGTFPCMPTPPYTVGVEEYCGKMTVGNDDWEFYVTRYSGDNMIHVYKNGEYQYNTIGPTTSGGVFGFGVQYTAQSTIEAFALIHPDLSVTGAETWYEAQSYISTHGAGIPYWKIAVYAGTDSVLVEERDWDETPSEDETDPESIEPQGGEYADRGNFSETHIMDLLNLPNPELTMTMNYGGFLRTYVLDQTRLTAVGSSLFSPNFWTGLKQKFEGLSDPLQMIVNCIQIPIWDIGGSSGTMRIGGVEVEDEQGHKISVKMTSSRYIKASMGAVTLKEIWGSEKDYNDVSISIFLPYVGIKELDPDIVVGCTMTLTCYIDIWTGDVLYLLHVSNASAAKKYFTAQSVPYRWSGNCAKTVPIGRVDNTNKMLTMAGAIAGLGAGAMLAGIGGAAVAGGVLSGAAGAVGASSAALGSGLGTMKAGGALAAVSAAKALHSGFNPTVHSSSGVTGSSGQMDYQYAYLMVKRGVPKYPNNWREQIGAVNYQTFQGVSMDGYTLFSEIHLTGMADASEAERAELERILTEEGVIL